MSYPDKALQLLADLGTTPTTIATALQELGIKGTRNNDSHCPLARYLQTHIPYVSIGTQMALVGADHKDATKGRIILTTPQRVFVDNFDQGKYPNLTDQDRPGGVDETTTQ